MHLQEKRQKLVAALYTYSSGLTRRATIAWLLYLQQRQTKAQHWQRAARHYVLRRKAVCFGSWLRTTRYLVPLRRNMGRLHTKVIRVDSPHLGQLLNQDQAEMQHPCACRQLQGVQHILR
jgi:hypothetical protein